MTEKKKKPVRRFAAIRAKQERYLEKVRSIPMPCPVCTNGVSLKHARRIEGDLYSCPNCDSKILHVVPALDPIVIWRWTACPTDKIEA